LTLPQDVSAAPDSDPTRPKSPFTAYFPAQTDDLICPTDAILDVDGLIAALQTRIASDLPAAELRKAVVAQLSDAMNDGRAAIADAIAANPGPSHARPAERAYAWLTDCLVGAVVAVSIEHLHPRPNPTSGERLAVLAVGGYGRGEMAPYSDVDLLFISPYKITGWAESVIESCLYMFWDLHLKVGHASRTIKDCVRLGREDFTIRTALLEQRFLCGYAPLAEELRARFQSDIVEGSASEFVEAKLEERTERLKKRGNQRYVVEPNVKEGKGGLRDLQTLFWIAKYVENVRDVGELVDHGVFTSEEFTRFRAAETFLMAVRNHLHLIADRAMDQLTFDMQVAVAESMGYSDRGGRRAVEHFMQDYFRHATVVGELTRILLTSLEGQHVKTPPRLQGLFKRRRKPSAGYHIVNGRLAIADNAAFLSDKLNLLRLFAEALRTGLLIHPDAMRLITANLNLIDDEMRNRPEAAQVFLEILVKYGNPERGLRRMNELGVLGAFIPEFQAIVAMMQFNMYHHYTVDEHTIQCISTLSQIERGGLVEELPIASKILEDGVNRKVLYVALLLHDIGKGRNEDHSILGAQIARKVAPRLGLRPQECETVEWLVRYHLLMSDMAQKRDLSDPRTLRDFAKAVKTKKRLDLLTVLTVCDIRGVGPGTWNNWKAALLRNLYRMTADALEHGLEAVNRDAREGEAKRALRAELSGWSAKDVRTEVNRHYGPYWQGLPTSVHVAVAKLLRDVEDSEINIDLMLDQDRDATRAVFCMTDHPGIFSRLAGALALVGANVVDARTFTSKDGYVSAVFWIQDADGHPYEEARLPRLRQMIHKTLLGEVVARDELVKRDIIKKRESKFSHTTAISFDNDGSEIYTMIEVDTRDRPGLLYDLSRTLAANNLSIASAQIATYGTQAVDTFYVKDMFGLKLHSEVKQKALANKLRDAIKAGAKRASDAA